MEETLHNVAWHADVEVVAGECNRAVIAFSASLVENREREVAVYRPVEPTRMAGCGCWFYPCPSSSSVAEILRVLRRFAV